MDLKYKLIEDGKAPYQKHRTDAGFDLFIRKIERPGPYTFKCFLGIAFEPEPGYFIKLFARSNLTKHPFVLVNSVGIIDQTYRGEVMAIFKSIDPDGIEAFPYEVGDRAVQAIIEKKIPVTLRKCHELSDTNRGAGGFGSTGKS